MFINSRGVVKVQLLFCVALFEVQEAAAVHKAVHNREVPSDTGDPPEEVLNEEQVLQARHQSHLPHHWTLPQ